MNAAQRRIHYRTIQRAWPNGTPVEFSVSYSIVLGFIERPSKVGRSVFVMADGVSVIKSISSMRTSAPKQEGYGDA